MSEPKQLFAPGGAVDPEAARRVARWHALWAGMIVAAGALITLLVGGLGARTYLAFAAMAAAGLLGAALPTAARTLLVLWAVATTVALGFSGGVVGSGLPWVFALFAAAVVLGRPMGEAAVLAAAVVGLSAATAAAPDGAGQGLIALASLATTGLALASALRRDVPIAAPLAAPVGADVSEQLAAAEAARDQAEAARTEAVAANTAKSRFLANMSHELRTPLNAIMGFADIMRNRLFGPVPDRYAEYAQLIHESGQHLLDLINDVLDMSKIEAERFRLFRETFDAREAMNAVLRLMRPQAEEAGIQLRSVAPDAPLTVDADKRALKQIALNLISNALKFTPRGGSVTVGLAAADGALELTVTDTGVGVSAEDLSRLGRPFEQAGDADSRAMGTGLGLSLVRGFADLHGGEMTMESALGEGTAVTVRLPVLVEAPEPEAAGAQVVPLAGR